MIIAQIRLNELCSKLMRVERSLRIWSENLEQMNVKRLEKTLPEVQMKSVEAKAMMKLVEAKTAKKATSTRNMTPLMSYFLIDQILHGLGRILNRIQVMHLLLLILQGRMITR